MTALQLFLSSMAKGQHVLHIGGGASGEEAALLAVGLHVTTADYARTGVVYEAQPYRPTYYDACFCSHTLEHVRNVGLFLDKLIGETKDGGLIGIVVPPAKHNIVGGHLTLWNAGLLCYNLILCGLDLSKAAVRSYDYNVAVLVRKRRITLPTLPHDNGDLELLAPYFPVPMRQDQDGRIAAHDWVPR